MIVFSDSFILEVIYLMVGFALLFLLIILYTRFTYVMDRKWKESIRELYQTLLAQYVNSKDPKKAKKIRERIIKISNSKEKKEILLDEVTDLYNSFNGICSKMAQELYQDMELYKLSIKKLKHHRWHMKMEGIVELSLMNYKEAYSLIVPLLYHKNVDVRRKAKIAIIELKKAKGLEDLVNLPTEMSNWTFLSILSILHRHPSKLTNNELNNLKNSDSESMKSLARHLEKHSLAV
ncbi:MAG: hypothetical protein RJQ14_22210 [Marinoscillum sp.]